MSKAARQGAGAEAGAGAGRPEAVGYSLPPLSWAVAAQDLHNFVRAAARGRRMVYARGVEPPRGHACWALAGELQAAGLVHLFERRRDGERQWIAERSSRPLVAPQRPVTLLDDDPRDAEIDRLYRVIRRVCRLGLPGPTNDELARRAELKNAERARYLLRALIAAGHVRVQDNGPRQRRIFTLLPEGGQSRGGAL